MPNGTLPITGYLGDANRLTSEFQGGIDELLAYVKSLKAEVDALSAQVIKEAAVRGVGDASGLLTDRAIGDTAGQLNIRGVGTGLTELPDNNRLNTRLGTTGNLGDMATKTASDYLAKSEFNPASADSVFTGSSNSVSVSQLSSFEVGWYVIKSSNFDNYHIYIRDSSEQAYGSAQVIAQSAGDLKVISATFLGNATEANASFILRNYFVSNALPGTETITQIYKV